MEIYELLDQLRVEKPVKKTKEITDNIKSIQTTVARMLEQQLPFPDIHSFYRACLKHPKIAKYLTPDVIKYLFTHIPDKETRIPVFGDFCKNIPLRDVIYYGFRSGLPALRILPTCKDEKDEKDLNYENVLVIARNIRKAMGEEEDKEEFKESVAGKQEPLSDKLQRIAKTCELVMKEQGMKGRHHLLWHPHIHYSNPDDDEIHYSGMKFKLGIISLAKSSENEQFNFGFYRISSPNWQ